MAAELTLVSLPSTAENMQRARHLADIDPLPDDEWIRVGDTAIIGISNGPAHVALRDALYADPMVRHLSIGPVSYLKAVMFDDRRWLPAPTAAVSDMWAVPQVVTPVRITATMVAMNRPDRSAYRNRRRWPRANRRRVKRWLTAQTGSIVWAEAW